MYKSSSATVRPDLEDAVLEYAGGLAGQFMGAEIFPFKNVGIKKGTFGKMPIENVTNSAPTGEKAPGSGYERLNSTYETDTFDCVKYGFEEAIDDDEAKEAAIYFDAESEISRLLMFRLMRAYEVRVATLAFSAAGFSGYTGNVGTEWDDATATPMNDIQDTILTMKQNIGGAIGGSEICVAMSEEVFRNVCQTTQVQGKLLGGNGGAVDRVIGADMLGAARLANILGVSKVFYSPAQSGGADIWDDEYCLVYLRSPNNIMRANVQLGRTFLWTDSTPNPVVVETYRDEVTEADIVRVKQHVDEKIFTYSAGYLLANITT